jgi:hypothetical protein
VSVARHHADELRRIKIIGEGHAVHDFGLAAGKRQSNDQCWIETEMLVSKSDMRFA